MNSKARYVLVAAVCCLGLFGCGDDNDNDNSRDASVSDSGVVAGSGGSGGHGGHSGSGTSGAGGLGAEDAGAEDSGAGDGGAMRVITLVATEFKFTPNKITASPGEKIRVVLMNDGQDVHRLELELPSGNVGLDANVMPGDSAMVDVTAPEATGNYDFFCPIDDHRALGMEGTLTVAR